MSIYKYFFTALLLSFMFQVKAQYAIEVQIKNMPDSTVYLGYYYGNKQYAQDTLLLDKKGQGVFKGKEKLTEGLYFILLPDNQIFELIIDKEQVFSVSTIYTDNAADLIKNMKTNGSKDMEVYVDYQKFMTQQNEKAIDLRKKMETSKTQAEKDKISEHLKKLNNEVHSKWRNIKTDYPNSLLASVLRCLTNIDVPEPPKDENGKIDSNFQYNYYKQHYFDNVDFSDARLIRTQFYHSKLIRYFDKIIVPAPDTIIAESKKILDKAEANDDVFQYTLQTLFNKYNGSEIMGMDKVFVFFAENYYLKNRAKWTDTTWLKKVKKRVEELKPNLIGNKAPDIHILTPEDKPISLSMIEAEFTILFFFEPDCGHCRQSTPKLKKLSDKYWEKGVEVFGIYTQVDKKEWLDFIKEEKLENWKNAWDPYNQSNFRKKYDIKGTPTIYLVDKDKIIIAKNIDVENLEIILENEIKIKEKQ